MSNMAARFANGMNMVALGERIRLEGLRRKLSLEVLAAQAGVSRSMLSDVERGAKMPSEVTFTPGRCESDRQQQRILLPQWHVERGGQAQHHLPARLGAA